MLCKHEVSGSIPLSSTRLIRCFPIAAIVIKLAPIWEQAGMLYLVQQVSRAPGLAFLGKRESMMFDNEIDWVMRIGRLFLVPAAVRQQEG